MAACLPTMSPFAQVVKTSASSMFRSFLSATQRRREYHDFSGENGRSHELQDSPSRLAGSQRDGAAQVWPPATESERSLQGLVSSKDSKGRRDMGSRSGTEYVYV